MILDLRFQYKSIEILHKYFHWAVPLSCVWVKCGPHIWLNLLNEHYVVLAQNLQSYNIAMYNINFHLQCTIQDRECMYTYLHNNNLHHGPIVPFKHVCAKILNVESSHA